MSHRLITNSSLALLTCLGLLGCYAGHPRDPGPDLTFETLLLQFKYSLYPLLSYTSPPTEAILSQEVNERIRVFVSQYPHELRQYREGRLSRAGRFRVDLSLFEELPLDPELPALLRSQQTSLMPGVALMDPLAQIGNMIPQILTREMAVSDLASFYTRAAIATPLFQATPGQAGEWEILADYYTRAFRFICHVDSGRVELKNYYRRKSPTSGDGRE